MLQIYNFFAKNGNFKRFPYLCKTNQRYMSGKKFHIILLLFVTFVMSSCNINRFVPEGKYLVKKNSVVIEEKKTDISKSELSSYITLKPYKDALQTNMPTWIYYKWERKPKSKVRTWLKNNFGKEPVYYDVKEANNSSTQMTQIGRAHV